MKETKWTKYYGDFVKAPEMEVKKTIYWAFKDVALKNADKIACEYLKLGITYRKFLSEIDKCAGAFTKLGVVAGDTVTICGAGTPHSVICIYALNKIGAIASLVSLDSKHTGLINPINNTKSQIVVMTVNDFNLNYEILKQTGIKKVILCKYRDYFNSQSNWDPVLWHLDKLDALNVTSFDIGGKFGTLSWNSFTKMSARVKDCSDCKAIAIYYHGGAALSGFNTVKFDSEALNNMARLSTALFGKEHHRVLCLVRVAFSFGFSFGVHSVLLTGNTCLININRATVFPYKAINKYRPDLVIGYPQILEGFKTSKKVYRSVYAGIKTVYSVGAYMPSMDYLDLVESFRSRGSQAEIIRLYGTTETCSVCAFNPPSLDNDRILGIPIPGVRMRIINQETGIDALPGTIGSIAVNTPAVMTGYLDEESDSSKPIIKMKDGRYWILTGDLGHEDEDGIFYFDGSRRRLFDRGGLHVYPQLIENEICSVIGVDECCVISVGESHNLKIKAIIQPERDYLFDNDKLNSLKDEIKSMNELELTENMRPDEYEFVAYLPMNPYGKVDYNKVKEMFKEDKYEQENQNDFGDDFDFSHDI